MRASRAFLSSSCYPRLSVSPSSSSRYPRLGLAPPSFLTHYPAPPLAPSRAASYRSTSPVQPGGSSSTRCLSLRRLRQRRGRLRQGLCGGCTSHVRAVYLTGATRVSRARRLYLTCASAVSGVRTPYLTCASRVSDRAEAVPRVRERCQMRGARIPDECGRCTSRVRARHVSLRGRQRRVQCHPPRAKSLPACVRCPRAMAVVTRMSELVRRTVRTFHARLFDYRNSRRFV